MYRIKDGTGRVLETTTDVRYVRWGRNGAPRICGKEEAEGVVLADGSTLCRTTDRPGLGQYGKVTVEETSLDSYVLEMREETKDNQYAIMEAIAELFEMQESGKGGA